MPRVTLSVLAFNRVALTRKCLESILRNTTDFELIVTDNASSDGTAEYLNQLSIKYPQVPIRLVSNTRNQGFVEPHNAAFAIANGEYFGVLNNDIEVGPGWVERMLSEFHANPNLALCGVQGSCCELQPDGRGRQGNRIDYVEASCLIGKTSILRRHGLFSEEFKFIYCEDADLGLRMRSLGYDITLVAAPVTHQGSATVKAYWNRVDFEGYQIRNHHVLRQRWGQVLGGGQLPPKERILVRRRGARGDVLFATPLLRALRKRFPISEISFSTECPEVLTGNPDVDFIVEPQSEGEGYSKVIDLDLAYERRPWSHVVDAYSEASGIGITDWRFRIVPDARAHESARDLGIDHGSCVLHPGMIAGWAGRQWPIDKFALLARGLREKGWKVILVGDRFTPPLPSDCDLRSLPFLEMAAVVERSGLFVGVDSLPLHVAQAFQRPVVGIFGSIEPRLRLLPGSNAIGIVADNVGCLGCHHFLPAPRTVTSSCFRGKERCLEGISVENVLASVESLVGTR